jgi:ligand-binding sensor domain-containing protein
MLEPPRRESRASSALVGIGLFLLLSQAIPVFAERLPLRLYTVADGLPDGHVERVIQDSHGLFWFATDRGLTRFDGYSFVVYGLEWGLPHRVVSDILEIQPGVFCVGTRGGLCRLDLSHVVANGDYCTRIRTRSDRFSNNILRLYRDRSGRLWIGTEGGLFTLDGGTTRPVGIGAPFRRFAGRCAASGFGVVRAICITDTYHETARQGKTVYWKLKAVS